jgi:hypothetical protein
MLKNVVRRRFDVLMVWSIDRLGRSVLHVANALAELEAAGVALYSDQPVISALRRNEAEAIVVGCHYHSCTSSAVSGRPFTSHASRPPRYQ